MAAPITEKKPLPLADGTQSPVPRDSVFLSLKLNSENGRHLSNKRLGPILESVLNLVEELVRDSAVHDAVVVAQRDIAH